MKKIAVIGEVLVEIMADHEGVGFLEPMALTGPFPSGAPAIFTDQAARLGQPCAIVSAVGDDDFGRLNLERLAHDGVDVRAIRVDPRRPTASAFVRYRPDGGRDFIFNIAHSACGRLVVDEAAASVLAEADHLHVMGSSLSSADLIALNLDAARAVKARGGTLSFDPNLRKELLGAPGLREAMTVILGMTDLFLPSGDEIALLADGGMREEDVIAALLKSGVRAIVQKKGAAGARYVDARMRVDAAAPEVGEVDPTGAGDTFAATFTSLWLRGTAPAAALEVAVMAGAHAVTRRGPMEGTCDLARLRAFGDQHGRPWPL